MTTRKPKTVRLGKGTWQTLMTVQPSKVIRFIELLIAGKQDGTIVGHTNFHNMDGSMFTVVTHRGVVQHSQWV
jgi:hypothetical protein